MPGRRFGVVYELILVIAFGKITYKLVAVKSAIKKWKRANFSCLWCYLFGWLFF
jgi:hypothetical protein